jgi:hypothetical protein
MATRIDDRQALLYSAFNTPDTANTPKSDAFDAKSGAGAAASASASAGYVQSDQFANQLRGVGNALQQVAGLLDSSFGVQGPSGAQAPGTAAPPSAPTQPAMPTVEDLMALPEDQKKEMLKSLGIPEKHLKKTKGKKLDDAFRKVAQGLLSPGKHKFKIKLDKKYEVKLDVGPNLELRDVKVKQKKGLFGKIWDGVKKAAPFVGAVLAPFTGGLSLVASAAIGAVDAIQNKNWLGLIANVAGGITGFGSWASTMGGGLAKLAASKGFQTLATGAQFASKAATAAQAAINAWQAKSPGAFLGALAGGVGAAGQFFGGAQNTLQTWADRLGTASKIALSGEAAINAIKNGDYLGAAQTILGGAAGALDGTRFDAVADRLNRYSQIVGGAQTVSNAIKTGDYVGAINQAIGLANQVGKEVNGQGLFDPKAFKAMQVLGSSAAGLQAAIKSGDPGAIAEAALRLGATVDNVRQGYYEKGGAAGQLGAVLLRAADGVDMAEKAIGLARRGDYAGAAGEALRLAQHMTQDGKFGQAAAVADRAGTLVAAIRTGDPTAIAKAAAELGTAVDNARNGYQVDGVARTRFAQTLMRVSDIVGTADKALSAFQNKDYASVVAEGLRLANQFHEDGRLEPAARVAEGVGGLIDALQSKNPALIFSSAKGLYDDIQGLRDAAKGEKRDMVRTGQLPPRDQLTDLVAKVTDLARMVVDVQRLLAA